MKKVLLVILMGIVATSYGAVDIIWLATGGFYFNATPGVGILGSGTGNSTIAQLIYSLDGNVDDALVGGGVSGDDVIWASLTITEDGINNDGTQFDSYAWFGIQNYTQAYVAGNFYARIFQDNSVGAGDWYFYTPMLTVANIVIPTPSQTLQMNTDVLNGNAIDVGATTAQVVPEPATALLFGIGGMGAWMIRRNKLKSKEEADA
jgi:hypothetical protein